MPKAKKNIDDLPDEVLIQWSDTAGETPSVRDDAFLMAHKDEAAAMEYSGKRVGVYRLVEVVNIKCDKKYTRTKAK